MADCDVTYEFVQGDDFSISMTLTDPNNADAPVDITNWTVAAQVRYSKKLLDDMTITIVNALLGQFIISVPKENTALWPARKLKCNIQFDDPAGVRNSSQTFIIDTQEDQTK